MNKILKLLIFCLLAVPMMAFAQEVEPDIGGMLGDLIKAIGDIKSVGWQAGVSGILVVIISTTKNSFLKQLIWDKLGWAKVMVAPVLAMIVVALTVQPFNAKAVLLALTTGAGAIALHQVLDALKDAPFIGETWKKVIDGIGKLLGRQESGK